MEDNERGKRWSKRQTTCIIDVPVSPASLFSSLLLSSRLFSSLYLSLPLCSSEYLRLPSRPFLTHPLHENTHASLPVSDTFRQESQPSSPSLDISREYAHACTLNKIHPSFHEEETPRSIFLSWVLLRIICARKMHIKQFFYIFVILNSFYNNMHIIWHM